MSKLNLLLFILLAVALSACSSRPTDSEIRRHLETQVARESGGLVELVDLVKTDGQEMEVSGIKLYKHSWIARAAFTDDCLSDLSGFRAVRIKACTGVECLAGLGKQKVEKGQVFEVSGTTTFSKSDNGWTSN